MSVITNPPCSAKSRITRAISGEMAIACGKISSFIPKLRIKPCSTIAGDR